MKQVFPQSWQTNLTIIIIICAICAMKITNQIFKCEALGCCIRDIHFCSTPLLSTSNLQQIKKQIIKHCSVMLEAAFDEKSSTMLFPKILIDHTRVFSLEKTLNGLNLQELYIYLPLKTFWLYPRFHVKHQHITFQSALQVKHGSITEGKFV